MPRKHESGVFSRSPIAVTVPVSVAFAVAIAVMAAGAGLLLPAGCAKVSTPGGSGAGNAPGSSTGGIRGLGGTGVTGSGTGTGGTSLRGLDAGYVTSSDGPSNTCQEGMYTYVPQIPTVYLMVDRSGSMFDCISTANVEPSCPTPADTPWNKLKDGVLMVVQALQKDVRFGFASFTGSNPRLGGMCPMLDKVPPKIDNYDTIATLYNSLPFQPNTTQGGMKFETPASQSLGLVGADLIADQAPGSKYILYVTDGEPDYCGDGNSLCPPDGVVGSLQTLKAQGITTIVFGIQSKIATDLPMGVLEAFANAGAGEPTVAPLRGTNPNINDLYDQCFNMSAAMTMPDDAAGGWTKQFLATGKPMMRGQTIGEYAATAGPTLPYKPDVADQATLVAQLSQALSGVKACTFDLNNVNGKVLTVDMTMLDVVDVKVMSVSVPLDPMNGWRLNSPSELELVGTACTNWRSPQNTQIDIKIPCKAIIVQ